MNISVDHPTERPNFTVVHINSVSIWFSYKTPIGVYAPQVGHVVRENEWGPTTGKHLNYLLDKKHRVSGSEFERLLKIVTEQYQISEIGV